MTQQETLSQVALQKLALTVEATATALNTAIEEASRAGLTVEVVANCFYASVEQFPKVLVKVEQRHCLVDSSHFQSLSLGHVKQDQG